MSGATDSGMVKKMGIVMGALLAFAILCAIAARILSTASEDPNDSMMRSALMERLKPVGGVRTSADDLPAAAQGLMAAADTPKSAEELVNGACAACHAAGVAEAPLLGDEAAWAERREAGLDALVASVINGKGSMPARGGSTYTDDEIRLSVQHIALFDTDETAAASSAEPATTDATNEATQETAQDAEGNAEENTSQATEASSDTEVAALVVGQVPEGLTDNVKAQVDGVCVGCHLSGVAQAPKIGDKEAWQVRADKGLDALTQSVIKGLNVMPARGGSTLTDEEMPLAIQYLMSK